MSDQKETKFADEESDVMDEDRRMSYASMPTNKRLTMKYDMSALKRIGEFEDALREKLGVVFDCDPDELPVDLDLNDIIALEPNQRKGALMDILKSAEGDVSAIVNETVEQLNNM